MLDSIKGATLERLKLFYISLEYGSLSKAAHVAHVSVSSVSRQIRQLEEELHATLIERHATGIVPTQEGKRLYEKAEILFTDFESMFGPLDPSRTAVRYSGQVSMLVAPVAACTLLCRALPFLHSLYPEITFAVRSSNGIKAALSELLAHAWHFSIASDYHLSRSFAFTPLFTTEICLVAPEESPLPEGITGDMKLLEKVPLIGLNEELAVSLFIRQESSLRGVSLAFRHIASSMALQLAMVKGRMGCALMDSAWIRGENTDGLRIVPMRIYPRRRFGVIQRGNACQPPHVSAVIDVLAQRFTEA